jgi:hypothetical protein
MKTVNYIKWNYQLFRLIILGIPFCFLAVAAQAQILPPGGGGPTNAPLDSWSFQDQINWMDDESNAPISFTNITSSYLGDGYSLVVATNVPAWLNYNIYEPGTGATNLVVNGPGSLTFWYAPANWASADTNAGGAGPGDWAQLIDVGEWTTNSSYGYWGLSVDPGGTNIYFVAQDGSGDTYVLSSPISWTTNYFHFIALTYSSTNVSLYLDGLLATNDPGGLSIWPSAEVASNGVFFGSDPNGQMQASSLFNTVATYGYPLSSNDVQTIFDWYYSYYRIMLWNQAMFNLSSAPSDPSPLPNTYDIITGQGNLQWVGAASTCISGTNAYNVWITNVVATMVGSGTNATMNVTFTIEGGSDGVPFDVFANSVLAFGTNGVPWVWMGQGYHCNTYMLTNLPGTTCFLILGTPQDSDFDGLTDAYERLVSKTNPYLADTSGDGISDSDEILNGYNPLTYNPGWKLDSDNDGLPDTYETLVGLNPNSAEAAPGLPSYSSIPIQ